MFDACKSRLTKTHQYNLSNNYAKPLSWLLPGIKPLGINNMMIYKRNVDSRLKLFRLSGFIYGIAFLYLLFINSVYAYQLLVLAIPFSFIEIKGLVIQEHSIAIERFFLFGWIKNRKMVEQTNYDDMVFVQNYLETDGIHLNSGELIDLAGCLFAFKQSRLLKLG
jgi:hypothetical protein